MNDATPMTCHKTVNNPGGQCLAATRNCSCKVVYVDALGRGWCRRHEPDEETKEVWTGIAEFVASKKK